jgi:hypothetical protein
MKPNRRDQYPPAQLRRFAILFTRWGPRLRSLIIEIGGLNRMRYRL